MLLLIALLPALAAAFVRAPRVASSPLVLTATRLEDRPVLGFLVEALAPLKETPSEGYARSPPRWMKPASASQLRKTHRSQHRHWFSDDLAHDFNRKHGVHAQPLAMRETLSKAETLAPFNESPLSLIEAVNKYLADALVEGVAPLDHPVNAQRVNREPRRHFKPVPMSKLRRTMSRDPYYFQH